MKTVELAAAVSRPELHRQLLGDYKGAYALGVTTSPHDQNEAALLLRVEGDASSAIPSEITVDGQRVPVVIKGGFKRPRAQ